LTSSDVGHLSSVRPRFHYLKHGGLDVQCNNLTRSSHAVSRRLLVREASLRLLFTGVGLSGADMGIAYLLPRMVGLSRATSMLLPVSSSPPATTLPSTTASSCAGRTPSPSRASTESNK
jgi:hypothetical protein